MDKATIHAARCMFHIVIFPNGQSITNRFSFHLCLSPIASKNALLFKIKFSSADGIAESQLDATLCFERS